MNYTFDATIKKHPNKDAAYVEIPFDVEKEFGAKRVKVKVLFDGIEYRGSIVKMGMPCYMIGITKEIRKKIGKEAGDNINVSVEKDEDVRKVELPEDFKDKLDKSECALEFYDSLSYSAKRKYCQWISSAKKEETRNARIEKAMENLINKIKL
ncbi:MAG: YdeI/OmpD-associated family protein [Clostridiaceae bacterium]|nr:YdeI/OmpD-associated family protein [Clostridiaceae bacterium]